MSKMLFRAICVLVVWFASLSAHGQTEVLLDVSNQELAVLADVFAKTGEPLAVGFIYKFDRTTGTFEVHTGLLQSRMIRNGMHARILIAAGKVSNLEEAKNPAHEWRAGTLFLETQNGVPVLSFHPRNSRRSTINDGETSVPTKVLETIADRTQMAIVQPSKKLFDTIEEGNIRRYGENYNYTSITIDGQVYTDFWGAKPLEKDIDPKSKAAAVTTFRENNILKIKENRLGVKVCEDLEGSRRDM